LTLGNYNGGEDFLQDPASTAEITQLLRAWREGDEAAFERLSPMIYGELRKIAHGYMRNERDSATLQATALVHEAYLRLVDAARVDWQDRAHFYAVSAQVMRRILVDAARTRLRAKRGGELARVDLDEIPDLGGERSGELLAMDDALNALAKLDPRKAKVIELRFFGGLSVEETAAVLRISAQSVMRDWRLARSWLMREISRGARVDGSSAN
jgi:RNA polymerase sigma factor (TIGR02999 family)